MMKIKNIFLLSLFLMTMLPLLAQQSESSKKSPMEIYDEGVNLFSNRYFYAAEKDLLSCVKHLKGKYRSSAYRMLALCALETGDHSNAKKYVNLLLKVDPYYQVTLQDPQNFEDLIDEAKSQSAGITTASRQAESIEEAPVPVTLITEDMIRYSGATTIQELLVLFVPGMSYIEGMESNVAMHGIYGLTQDKILFLQDGHQLNGSSTNAEAPDYRNCLDKIQQIEVLRGPASSLYGNVALTAVVNIITRKGAVLNGGRISGTFGTQQTYGADFVIGGGNNVVDVVGWGSINSSNGFKHEMDNMLEGSAHGISTLYTGAYNHRPSYDIGIKARWGDFTMTVNSQRSKKTPYVNVMQFSGTQKWENFYDRSDFNVVRNYNVDKYEMIGSNGPGVTRTNHHVNLDYSHSFGNFDFQTSGHISMEHTSLYNVLGDSIDGMIGLVTLVNLVNTTPAIKERFDNMSQAELESALIVYNHTNGVFQVLDWENITFGGQAQISTNYNFLGHGSALFGFQYEHFSLTNCTLYLGGSYSSNEMMSSGNVFDDSMEAVLSGYTQLKHYFSDKLILNAGLRYDHKIRFNNTKIRRFSPRLSFIYRLNDAIYGRASYNYSFVDAAYIYRTCAINMFSGGKDMNPETMSSFQASVTYHKPNSPFQAEVNAYYNTLNNLISEDLTLTSGYLFVNAGRVKQYGFDISSQYATPRFFANFNATWQKVISSSKYNVVKDNRLGIPTLMGKMTLAWSPYAGKGHGFFTGGKLWLTGNVKAQSKTYYQTVNILSSYTLKDFSGYNTEVPSNIILGLGISYEWKYLDLSFNVRNVTNNDYMVGSNLADGIPYPGRQFLGKVTIKF